MMPVYLFTFHAYGTWMPDRPQGYVVRGQGIMPADRRTADRYRAVAKHDAIVFSREAQAVLVAAARAVTACNAWRLHQIATDVTHVHTLVSWRGFIEWRKVRRTLRYRYTNELNLAFGDGHRWLSRGGSRKRVRDRDHFRYLMDIYLPKHRGLRWSEDAPRDQNRGL